MIKNNLKSLNWEALLNNSSDNEYDSDETLCEEELGINATNRKGFQANDNLATTMNRSIVKPQAELRNGPSIFYNETVMSKDGNRSSYKQFDCSTIVEANLNEDGRSGVCGFSGHSEITPGVMVSKCSDASESTFGLIDMSLKSKNIEENFEVIDGRNSKPSKISPDVMCMLSNCTDASESTFGFTDMSLNSNKIETNFIMSNNNGFPKPLQVTSGALDGYNNCSNASESTFGITEMSLACIEGIEYESKIKTEAEQRPEEQEQFLNCSSKKERRFSTEPNFLAKSDIVKQLYVHSPIGLTNEQFESQPSNTTLNNDPSKKNKIFNDILSDFEQAKESPLDPSNHGLVGQLNHIKGTLNLDPVDFSFADILENAEIVTFNKNTTDYFAHSYNGIQQDVDNSSLQTENCFFGISTESLVNIIGSDFIEETFEDVSVSRRNVCSPPLTLIEKTNKKNVTSKKILPHERTRNKRDIPEKILPVRTCLSKYVNQSKRYTELEEPSESSSSFINSKIIKTRAKKATSYISHQGNQNNEHAEVKKAEWLGRKTRRDTKKKKLKALPVNKSSQKEKTVKVSLLQNLKEMEQALYQIEQKTLKWVNGEEEHFVSREKAFEMLMETQSVVKILESFQVPMRCKGKMTEMRSKLCERAKKLALAIDAAIAESDQMFREECYNKLFDEKSVDSCEEKAEVTVAQKKNSANHPKFIPCNGLTENAFNHHLYENSSKRNSVTHQGQQKDFPGEIQKAHLLSKNNEDSVGSLFIPKPNPETIQEKYTLNIRNWGGMKNNPKPILKYSSSESSTGKCVSNGKHISFSDDIEFRYLSGSTSSSLPSSGQVSSQSQPSFEMDRNGTNNDGTENITRSSMHYPEPVSSQNTLRTNNYVFNEIHKKKTCDQFGSVHSKFQEKLNGKSKSETCEVQESVVLKESSEESVLTTSQRTPYDFKLLKINDVTQLQKLSSHDTADTEGIINSVEEYVEKHSPTSLSYSESSTEGFGFSEEPLQTNQLLWGDVSIMSIKYLRIKSPDEFTPVKEDDEWLEDLDKW